jgi:hypothetical protein
LISASSITFSEEQVQGRASSCAEWGTLSSVEQSSNPGVPPFFLTEKLAQHRLPLHSSLCAG